MPKNGKNKCLLDECNDNAKTIGYCSKHYQRLRNNGDPRKLLIAPKGTGSLCKDGYLRIHVNGRRVKEHIYKAELVLGRSLPKGSIVHHINGIRIDNQNKNLVICQDQAYHKLLHRRANALNAGFPAHYRKCPFCQTYDDPLKMKKQGQGSMSHQICSTDYLRKWIQRNKGLLHA